jgi:hypothetical protein
VRSFPDELSAFRALVKRTRTGDVAAVMAHVERREIADWLRSAGFSPVGTDRLQELLA